jgi:hypothetical protein
MSASNAGRKKGSKRRSRWTKEIEALASQFRNADPVLARGTGRLTFEFMAEIDQDSSRNIHFDARNLQCCASVVGYSSEVYICSSARVYERRN